MAGFEGFLPVRQLVQELREKSPVCRQPNMPSSSLVSDQNVSPTLFPAALVECGINGIRPITTHAVTYDAVLPSFAPPT